MDRKIRKSVTGYCPQLNQNSCISIEYAEFYINGDSNTHYKALGFKCDHVSKCQYIDEYGRCPIFTANENK